ncbi:hypothetical protein GFY24_39025 [Nocardia sp. SYP-A9097]|uniref:hypothetical protein n=1 Tax=Nocardia sp. SYP-A9097 TaxID=2663237 RepID=UPI00129A1C90|nr:hypothetical protein [Nocardia sp. SYP-A9097]MRH93344.1 hypothetical protein [Nocardia sp. SYP-A9097]
MNRRERHDLQQGQCALVELPSSTAGELYAPHRDVSFRRLIRATTDQLCAQQEWPRPVPGGAEGKVAMQLIFGAFSCFDKVSALAPDGHDIMNDSSGVSDWRIVDVSPISGTKIARTRPASTGSLGRAVCGSSVR